MEIVSNFRDNDWLFRIDPSFDSTWHRGHGAELSHRGAVLGRNYMALLRTHRKVFRTADDNYFVFTWPFISFSFLSCYGRTWDFSYFEILEVLVLHRKYTLRHPCLSEKRSMGTIRLADDERRWGS